MMVDDAQAAAPSPRPVQPGPEEGRFDYGEAFSGSPSIRYRQMKAIEGRDVARAWAKQHMLRLAFSGVSVQEIAQTFGFQVRWTEVLLSEAKREVREFTATSFDGMGVVAEHIMLYRQIRENAYFAMNKTVASDFDRYRARDSLMAVMRQEIEFVEKVGGLRGVSLASSSEDEAARAAREMSGRIGHLVDALEDCLEGDLDDAEPIPVEETA